ncbi:zinc ribbon-containing protein [Pseudoalteromonas tunicata]|jgi:hypothetical protein|uniref:Zinc ribbon-containing protein n=1 Tax=Pseudoalteromonas tunicata D2 TaxID=87626 RepID=A4CDE9_9GAMM|nr:hypothetical protein [Pseudoalteromonas tunicata]ATC94097.1 hypothetical protein PTUN_a1472 [Pseudoalteromonas tunicata]AXT29877.1 hypothetical protein D1819_02885 [Pseudoalteromonas tunicata]EAR27592.1 hypothetical protein PTD2_16172 [Pseudoalteromonas tunicata D2]MDP4983892.1 zinc ribbon-containing protein [Pseudoalteromonas tunicata]
MNDSKNYQKWLDELHLWLSDVKKHEVKQLLDYLQQGEHEIRAITGYSAQQFNTYKEYFLRDLAHWQSHHQQYNQLAWQELKESFWYELTQLGDRSKVEWAVILDDFEHNGVYQQGDWVALGELRCKQCQHLTHYYHPNQLDACAECGGIYFTRQALSP